MIKAEPGKKNVVKSENELMIRRCASVSIITSFLLIFLKLVAWYYTNSITLLSSMMDSGMDCLLSVINLVALRYAFKPADDDHRFGHAKAQDLAIVAQVVIVGYLAVVILIAAIRKFIHPVITELSTIGVCIMLITLCSTIALITYQKSVIRKTNSNAIKSDSAHYITDMLSDFCVIIALITGGGLGVTWIDPTLGILLAIYIFIVVSKPGLQAYNNLMDRELDEKTRLRIYNIIAAHPKVLKVTDLKTRCSGHILFIHFDFMTDANASLKESHATAHEIEANIWKDFPDAEIFMHQEPAEY